MSHDRDHVSRHLNWTQEQIAAAAPYLSIKLLRPGAVVPTRGNPHDVGLDLYALVEGRENGIRLCAGDRKLIPTGIAIAVPQGYYGRIAPRSGMAVKHGIDVLAGVVDPGYRGEIFVLLLNTGSEMVWVRNGDRVGQLIIEAAASLAPLVVTDLGATVRGASGFGSTGL